MAAQAGELVHRVQIQRLTTKARGDGTTADEWETVETRLAAIKPLKGRERLEAQRLESIVTIRVVMRYWDGLSSANRLLFGKRILNIEYVINEDELNRWLQIMCREAA